MCSFNLQKLGRKGKQRIQRLNGFVEATRKSYENCILLLQEVGSVSADQVLSKGLLLGQDTPGCRIFVPQAVRSCIHRSECVVNSEGMCRLTLVQIADTCLASLHLPDGGNEDVVGFWLDSLTRLFESWKRGKRKESDPPPCEALIFGADLNYELPSNFDVITGSFCLDRTRAVDHKHQACISLIAEFMAKHNLACLNYFPNSQCFSQTHTFAHGRSADTNLAKLDVIAVTHDKYSGEAFVESKFVPSDHWPVVAGLTRARAEGAPEVLVGDYPVGGGGGGVDPVGRP